MVRVDHPTADKKSHSLANSLCSATIGIAGTRPRRFVPAHNRSWMRSVASKRRKREKEDWEWAGGWGAERERANGLIEIECLLLSDLELGNEGSGAGWL